MDKKEFKLRNPHEVKIKNRDNHQIKKRQLQDFRKVEGKVDDKCGQGRIRKLFR